MALLKLCPQCGSENVLMLVLRADGRRNFGCHTCHFCWSEEAPSHLRPDPAVLEQLKALFPIEK